MWAFFSFLQLFSAFSHYITGHFFYWGHFCIEYRCQPESLFCCFLLFIELNRLFSLFDSFLHRGFRAYQASQIYFLREATDIITLQNTSMRHLISCSLRRLYAAFDRIWKIRFIYAAIALKRLSVSSLHFFSYWYQSYLRHMIDW